MLRSPHLTVTRRDGDAELRSAKGGRIILGLAAFINFGLGLADLYPRLSRKTSSRGESDG